MKANWVANGRHASLEGHWERVPPWDVDSERLHMACERGVSDYSGQYVRALLRMLLVCSTARVRRL